MGKLAVFDLDGTLHHTELALAPAIARAVADITGGPEPEYSLINSLYGEPLELFCKKLTGSDSARAVKRFTLGVKHHQAITLPTLGRLYPGVQQMLTDLKTKGFDLAVLSNAHTDYIELVTDTLGIKNMFVQLIGRTDHPSKTGRLAELSSGYDFTVMVGDRYHDIKAGLENLLPVIACSYGYGTPDEHKGAVCVSSAQEIVSVVDSLSR